MEKVTRALCEAPPQTVGGLRALARSWGLVVGPVGIENSKTGVPSTYRPVGVSCPPSCRYLGDPASPGPCYALAGQTHMVQLRARLDGSATAAAIAMVAAAKKGTVARLHVSGDFCEGGKVDEGYIAALVTAATTVRQWYGITGPVAFTYTHVTPAEFEPVRIVLAGVGIEVLYSDLLEVGGVAVVGPQWEGLTALRASRPRLKFVRCPAQTSTTVQCKSCLLCPVARERGVVVCFAAHGARAKALDATRSHHEDLQTD